MSVPHDRPTATELIEAVREWLEGDVQPNVDGRLRYHSRVAINVLSMVERELELGDDHDRRHADRLAALGVADDGELASAIRADMLAVEPDEVRRVLLEVTLDKLAVANPRYTG
ncbi:MAG: DUF6285 domain-containing protein [Actinomycetota bacterium]